MEPQHVGHEQWEAATPSKERCEQLRGAWGQVHECAGHKAGATAHLLVSAPPGTHRVLQGSGHSLSFSETNGELTP